MVSNLFFFITVHNSFEFVDPNSCIMVTTWKETHVRMKFVSHND